jgi:hypothetical protein
VVLCVEAGSAEGDRRASFVGSGDAALAELRLAPSLSRNLCKVF